MHQNSHKLLNLLFNAGETFCVSPNKKGYHSIEFDALIQEKMVLLSPPDAYNPEPIITKCEEIQLVALNPIKGWRRDDCVYKYRSFLVELDEGALSDQFDYVKNSGMPYSACIFSGSKSLHYAITLSEDLPDEDTYRLIAEWILNIMAKADQMTKNPSRSVRFAGNMRKETGKEMKLLDIKGRISFQDLIFWLNKYPDKNPILSRPKYQASDLAPEFNGVHPGIWKKLRNGIDASNGRNNEWFKIFIAFSNAGYDYDSMVSQLSQFFQPDRDFTEREWESIAKKACKSANRGR